MQTSFTITYQAKTIEEFLQLQAEHGSAIIAPVKQAGNAGNGPCQDAYKARFGVNFRLTSGQAEEIRQRGLMGDTLTAYRESLAAECLAQGVNNGELNGGKAKRQPLSLEGVEVGETWEDNGEDIDTDSSLFN